MQFIDQKDSFFFARLFRLVAQHTVLNCSMHHFSILHEQSTSQQHIYYTVLLEYCMLQLVFFHSRSSAVDQSGNKVK